MCDIDVDFLFFLYLCFLCRDLAEIQDYANSLFSSGDFFDVNVKPHVTTFFIFVNAHDVLEC
jgi:hypothetical protein